LLIDLSISVQYIDSLKQAKHYILYRNFFNWIQRKKLHKDLGFYTEKGMKMTFFISPTKGRLSFNQVFRDMLAFVNEHPEDSYKLIVGTDSQVRTDVYYVTAIVVLRVGKGGRFYYTKERQRGMISLKQRIFLETARSLEVASRLAGKIMSIGKTDLNIEIHLDVGEQGKTKEIIREVVGMVTGSGFDARIKPDSYGASKVADKFTK